MEAHTIPLMTATCRVCGERVSNIEAPLHIEDHKNRGELPARTRPA